MDPRTNQYSKLRIIGGKFRGRKIFFNGKKNQELRPSLDRVRETVFNWLNPYIVGANCLDLFSGSGVFSFEALSRGANFVLAVESNQDTYKNILQNKTNLNILDQEFQVINTNALKYLEISLLTHKNNEAQKQQDPTFDTQNTPARQPVNNRFNIIFLDPPFNFDLNLLLTSLNLLIKNNFLEHSCKIYFETNQGEHIFKKYNFSPKLHLYKTSQAGKVHFYLVEYNE